MRKQDTGRNKKDWTEALGKKIVVSENEFSLWAQPGVAR